MDGMSPHQPKLLLPVLETIDILNKRHGPISAGLIYEVQKGLAKSFSEALQRKIEKETQRALEYGVKNQIVTLQNGKYSLKRKKGMMNLLKNNPQKTKMKRKQLRPRKQRDDLALVRQDERFKLGKPRRRTIYRQAQSPIIFDEFANNIDELQTARIKPTDIKRQFRKRLGDPEQEFSTIERKRRKMSERIILPTEKKFSETNLSVYNNTAESESDNFIYIESLFLCSIVCLLLFFMMS